MIPVFEFAQNVDFSMMRLFTMQQVVFQVVDFSKKLIQEKNTP
jgi:hypothetical protein